MSSLGATLVSVCYLAVNSEANGYLVGNQEPPDAGIIGSGN
jgi:hypothetical protein